MRRLAAFVQIRVGTIAMFFRGSHCHCIVGLIDRKVGNFNDPIVINFLAKELQEVIGRCVKWKPIIVITGHRYS